MIGLKALAATLSVPAPISFSGSFSKTAAPSGGYVTSDTITVGVPAGSLASIQFRNYVITGSIGGLEYNKNSAGFVGIADGVSVTGFVDGQPLIIRAGAGLAAGESFQFQLYDDGRGVTLGTYTLLGS